MSGYGTNVGLTSAAGSAIRGIADEVRAVKPTVTESAVSAADFGRAHTAAGAPYIEGLNRIANTIERHAAAMENYAGLLESTAADYDSLEQINAAELNQAGGAR